MATIEHVNIEEEENQTQPSFELYLVNATSLCQHSGSFLPLNLSQQLSARQLFPHLLYTIFDVIIATFAKCVHRGINKGLPFLLLCFYCGKHIVHNLAVGSCYVNKTGTADFDKCECAI